MKKINELLKNEVFRSFLILIVGVTIGILFYPSKRIEEKISQKYEKQVSLLKEEHKKEIENLTEKYSASLKQTLVKLEESEKRVSHLLIDIRDLKSKQKVAKFKIVRPDGTIEEKEFTETETSESSKVITQIQEEFKTKIAQIEQKWADIHKQRVLELKRDFEKKQSEYESTIASLKKEKKETVNEKRFGLEIGLLNNKNYYGHGTMDLWGPMFIGLHGEMGQINNSQFGIGVGIRF
jgi:hypothetical protein